ncbi:hypothetical protein [Clavibacter sp.]|uniref:hypothetical protein n=1 Tax=Clavibacter sp. TaxID=1871044 RepID=UPI0019A81E0E|nr:hypothetical protein [Clavibacter sp.]MBD5381973.1 hypothetical protein [Clavibacter sp.]
MTSEDIHKLAEECSLYYQGRPAKRGYELSNRLTIESYALMTLGWLSKDYFIVPKDRVEKIAERCESISAVGEQIGSSVFLTEMGNCKKLIEYLFDVKIVKEGKL